MNLKGQLASEDSVYDFARHSTSGTLPVSPQTPTFPSPRLSTVDVGVVNHHQLWGGPGEEPRNSRLSVKVVHRHHPAKRIGKSSIDICFPAYNIREQLFGIAIVILVETTNLNLAQGKLLFWRGF